MALRVPLHTLVGTRSVNTFQFSENEARSKVVGDGGLAARIGNVIVEGRSFD